MNLTLSWDLFVVVFFVIITAYSLIIGRNNTLKVIIGTYVAMIASDAVGYLFQNYLSGSGLFMSILQMASVNSEQEAVIFIKIIAFVTLVILYAVKGAFTVDANNGSSGFSGIIISCFYAFLSAGLVISAVLIFVSGGSFIGSGLTGSQATLNLLANNSNLIGGIVKNSYIWFSLPALLFLVHSFYESGRD